MRSAVAQELKRQTACTHRRVEAALGLLAPQPSVERIRAVLGRFTGFWQGTERGLDEWARREPELADQLAWPRRRRREALRHDLLRLGVSVRELAELPEAPAVFDTVDTADALGWLYVSEGSTLGGAVIDRTLRMVPDTDQLRLRTFTPYLEGPGPMWRAYLDILGRWVGGDPARSAAVVGAAVATFTALEAWLAPLAGADAA